MSVDVYLRGVEDDEEQRRLHAALRESVEQMKNGQTLDAVEALAELRAHRDEPAPRSRRRGSARPRKASKP